MENNQEKKGIIKAIGLKRLLAIIYFSFIIIVIIALNPVRIYKDVRRYIAGHPAENTTLMEKIKNDMNIKPFRQIVEYNNQDEREYNKLSGLTFNPRREIPSYYFSENAAPGYRLIQGVFDFTDGMHGAILLNGKGEVVNQWKISQEGDSKSLQKDTNVFPHGIEISPDGSIIAAYSSGSTLTKYDYCGNITWRIYGLFHHSVSFDDDNNIWTWGYSYDHDRNNIINFSSVSKIDYNNGNILKTFNVADIMEANPEIDIFGSLQDDTAKGSKWLGGTSYFFWHPNDVEPLPAKWANKYPNFKPGDLLISLRSSNLIFVLNPDTLKVIWWRQGLTRRQHDPDWTEDGTISVLNNNMHRGYSSIVRIDPKTFDYTIPLKGEDYNFYTWMRGKHQVLPGNGYLITSPQQGRIFELSSSSEITFELLNIYNEEENEYLAVSEAKYLPSDFFKNLPICN